MYLNLRKLTRLRASPSTNNEIYIRIFITSVQLQTNWTHSAWEYNRIFDTKQCNIIENVGKMYAITFVFNFIVITNNFLFKSNPINTNK